MARHPDETAEVLARTEKLSWQTIWQLRSSPRFDPRERRSQSTLGLWQMAIQWSSTSRSPRPLPPPR
jgi:hypothetical protein